MEARLAESTTSLASSPFSFISLFSVLFFDSPAALSDSTAPFCPSSLYCSSSPYSPSSDSSQSSSISSAASSVSASSASSAGFPCAAAKPLSPATDSLLSPIPFSAAESISPAPDSFSAAVRPVSSAVPHSSALSWPNISFLSLILQLPDNSFPHFCTVYSIFSIPVFWGTNPQLS